MKKQFVLNLIENWIIAVCENKQEAILVESLWASAVLLVEHRWKWETYSAPNAQMITEVISSISIPVFVRVRHWHFAEAEIAQRAWAKAIVEAIREIGAIASSIKKDDFDIPIISEIWEVKDNDKLKANNWAFYLILWDYWSWNIVPLTKKLKKWDTQKYWKVFIWWWISSPADLELIDKDKVKWYFIWTALFYFDTEQYFEEVIENTIN